MAAQLATSKPQNVLSCINDKGFLGELRKAIRTGVPAATMARIVLTQIRKNPKIQECSPQSFMAAVLTGCQLGLEFGREAHLVPYNGECQLIPDYKGLIQLVLRSGQVASLIAENVWTGEEFAYRPADPKPILHQPLAPSRRGAYLGTYAMCWMKDSAVPFCEWMWAEEVWKVRCRAASAKFKSGPWFHADDQWEMTKKTVLKRLTKHLPMTAELKRAIELDTAAELGETQDFVDFAVIEQPHPGLPEPAEEPVGDIPPDMKPTGVEPVKPKKGKNPQLDADRAKIRRLVAEFGAGGEEIVCAAGLEGMEEVARTGDLELLRGAIEALEREQSRIKQAVAKSQPTTKPAEPPLPRRTGGRGELFDNSTRPSTDPPMKG